MKPKPKNLAHLPSLAVELTELIAQHTDDKSILSLRLVCRALQTKTFHLFARRFFATIKTDLSSESLARINALSSNVALRPYIQCLAFMLQNGVGRGLIWSRHTWGPLSAPLEVDAIRTLRDNLITRLTKCRSFFIVCRYPEGHPDMKHVTVTDAVAVFFALVVEARLPVSSFHLIYANKYSRTLIMDMRRIPKMIYRQPQFKIVWANLQKLSLEQYLTLDNFGFLLELVLSATSLKTLLLNLGSHDLACEFMHEIAESASLTQLSELALFRTSACLNDLLNILTRVKGNLSALTLYHVSLASDDNWADVLSALGGFVSLQSISLYYLWATAPEKEVFSFPDLCKAPVLCGEGERQSLHVFYEESAKTPAVLGVEYSGKRMGEVLGLLQVTGRG
ncbi:hypothetical protein N7532_001080 [Penicillium argentinense]|uniref:F-box domain-containing protein n=1 Tax=Penicillium argentinense TaxID=1131581 RepID=A0A9W9G1U9_9EURO|nr:uncharacterized protein N7532_001080 [Penicillium argentinense]KAJ5110545.1 hypothetical protein N7532_001080 [Penicillium argentinense]